MYIKKKKLIYKKLDLQYDVNNCESASSQYDKNKRIKNNNSTYLLNIDCILS